MAVRPRLHVPVATTGAYKFDSETRLSVPCKTSFPLDLTASVPVWYLRWSMVLFSPDLGDSVICLRNSLHCLRVVDFIVSFGGNRFE
jgi:hypothetical protein